MTRRDRPARRPRRRAARRSPARRRYSGEIALPGLAHAALVGATIPSGRVVARSTRDAPSAPTASLAVLTHEQPAQGSPAAPQLLPSLVGGPAPGQSFFPMQDDGVHYAGQPVAIVVADTPRARAARGVARRA